MYVYIHINWKVKPMLLKRILFQKPLVDAKEKIAQISC